MELECNLFRDNLIEFFFKSNVNKFNPLQKIYSVILSKMQVLELDVKLFWTIRTKANLEAKLELMCSVSNEK